MMCATSFSSAWNETAVSVVGVEEGGRGGAHVTCFGLVAVAGSVGRAVQSAPAVARRKHSRLRGGGGGAVF